MSSLACHFNESLSPTFCLGKVMVDEDVGARLREGHFHKATLGGGEIQCLGGPAGLAEGVHTLIEEVATLLIDGVELAADHVEAGPAARPGGQHPDAHALTGGGG